MRPVYYLAVFVPVALALDLADATPPAVFFVSALAMVPAAALMSDATEQLAERSGPGVAGLLNVTFGNTPELIIAVFALADGLHEVVKATIVGSVIGNSLLVLGAAMLAGGWRRTSQTFSRAAAQTQAGMLLVSVSALLLPAVFQLAHDGDLPAVDLTRKSFGSDLENLSLAVALVLIATYVAGLFFSLRTHRALFNPEREEYPDTQPWTVRRSLIVLVIAAVLVAVASDTLVGSIAHASREIGLSQFFIGAFVVAIVGNAAEHWVAVVAAVKDKMDLSVNIAIGSSVQIALFVTPVLVLLSFVVGPAPMALVFNGYELAALLLASLITLAVTADGESTWFEGVQLLAVYVVLGLVFVFA
jgi:Ca2+:H+ antiporter